MRLSGFLRAKWIARLLACALAVCWIPLLSGCTPPPDTDVSRVKLLESRYPDFDFVLDDVYVEAKLRQGASASDQDVMEIYKTFFLDEATGQNRDTRFVYLNYYKSRDEFQYQLYFDPATNAVAREERADHY